MGTTRKTTLSLLAAAVLVNTAPPALADPLCVPTTAGTGSCEFQDGQEAAGTYTYERILVPAGVTVRATGPLVLQATALIHVAGEIVADPATLPGAPGTSIRLASGGDVLVEGRVVAGDGASAETRELHVASAAGDMGGAGGSVYVSTGPLGIFTLASGGHIRSGNGGVGGETRLIQVQGDMPSTTLSATGGNGGAGGTISIDAITAAFHGRVVVGEGGKGGVGYALSEPGTLAASPGAQVSARGGEGGASGDANLPPGVTVFTLYDLGLLEGGRGGDGGDSYAYPAAVPTSLYGAEGGGSYVDNGNSVCSGERCTGAGAYASGGAGGPGIVAGGKGGDATAIAGPGGPGGTGSAGTTLDCHYFGPWSSTCGYHPGGQGGLGGDGGTASAVAGNGGMGWIQGGAGGNAHSQGGRGGPGGKGGTGGHGFVYYWNGNLDYTTAATIGCVSSAGIACNTVTHSGVNGVCAARGPGGESGYGNGGQAIAGRGGTNMAGIVTGSPGTSTFVQGGRGELGSPGNRPSWIVYPGIDLCANSPW